MLKTSHYHNLAKEKKWELYNPIFAVFKVNIIKLTINYHNRQFMSYKVQYTYIYKKQTVYRLKPTELKHLRGIQMRLEVPPSADQDRGEVRSPHYRTKLAIPYSKELKIEIGIP